MAGYVQHINAATLNVHIGGIRIGAAKFTRLAQINLNSRVITFSRFAIEDVPERGRRYLVIHELAHVLEAGHTKRFWSIVGTYEPNYKEVREELRQAFSRNVRAELIGQREGDGVFDMSCTQDDMDGWADYEPGIMCGGYE
jgi:predicted metal-dependent hydrolase